MIGIADGAPDGPDAHAQSGYERPPDWTAPGAALVSSAATERIPSIDELGRVHIMGIAGAGMSALARIMLARGVPVSGCEGRESTTVTALRALGADVRIGHSLDHLDAADTVVYTTAINPQNFELLAARERGLRVLRRAAGLAATITGHRAVAVAGTHGKTTTTSLLTVAAQACGLDPSFAVGANLYESGLNGHAGTGDLFIVEADESDGSFLLLRPELAIVTNIEADHLENHGDFEGVFHAFELFVDRIGDGVPGAGRLVVCADDPGARRLAGYARSRGLPVTSYGESPDADVRVTDIAELPDGVEFTLRTGADGGRRVRIGSLLGRHMALNGAGAFALAGVLGLDPEILAKSWASFQGVHRRFEFRGEAYGVRVFDDYAHHPTEVRAALAAARSSLLTGGRLIAVFQPGTYSRTQTFAAEFGAALAEADLVVVMDVFPAREEPIPGITGDTIAARVPLAVECVSYEPSWSSTADRVAALARPGDVVMTMGIGDVHLVCPEILAALTARGADLTTLQDRPAPLRFLRGRGRLTVALVSGALALVLAWVFLFSPVFGAADVSVRGARQVPAAQIRSAAAVPGGSPLLRLDTGAIGRRILDRLPGIRAVTVHRSFPRSVVISVQERTAVAYRPAGSGYQLVDASDVAFRNTPALPKTLPVVASSDAGPAGDAECAVAGSLDPSETRAVLRVSAASPESVTLTLRDGRTVLWGGVDRGAEKAKLLAVLLRQPGTYFDISDPGTVISRGGS